MHLLIEDSGLPLSRTRRPAPVWHDCSERFIEVVWVQNIAFLLFTTHLPADDLSRQGPDVAAMALVWL
jgi:hypothetical protein